MVYDVFYVLLDPVGKFFVEDFSICSSEILSCNFISLMYHSDVWVCYKPVSDDVHIWPLAVFSNLQAIHCLWLIPPGVAAPRVGQAALKS